MNVYAVHSTFVPPVSKTNVAVLHKQFSACLLYLPQQATLLSTEHQYITWFPCCTALSNSMKQESHTKLVTKSEQRLQEVFELRVKLGVVSTNAEIKCELKQRVFG